MKNFCISFLWKSNEYYPPLEEQFNYFFREMGVNIINTQVVTADYTDDKGHIVYQETMYVWYTV